MAFFPALAIWVALTVHVGSQARAPLVQHTFRSHVEMEELDVIAVDANNRPVRDLRQDEIQVLEDGRAQPMASFAFVDLPSTPNPPPVRDIATNEDARDGRLIVLILDDVHTRRTRTREVQEVARRVVEQLSPADRVAILLVSLGARGTREFTTSRAALMAAIDAFDARSALIERIATGAAAPGQLDEPDVPFAGPLGSIDLQAAFESSRPLAMIGDVCAYLTKVQHRRKAVVYVGDGPPMTPSGTVGSQIERQELDTIRAVTAARRANVALYVINPHSVLGPATRAAQSPTGDTSSVRVTPLSPTSLAALSDKTGGFSVAGNDAIDAVDGILWETGCYYLIGYYAPTSSRADGADFGGDPPGRFATIQVRTTRPGVRLRARNGYWKDPLGAKPSNGGAEDREEPLRESVSGLLPDSSLPLRALVTALAGGDSGRGRRDVLAVVEVTLPPFAPATLGGALVDDAELLALAVQPGKGTYTSVHTRVRLNLGQMSGEGLVSPRYQLCTRLSLPPGEYQIRLGVRSTQARRTGSVYADVTVPVSRHTRLSVTDGHAGAYRNAGALYGDGGQNTATSGANHRQGRVQPLPPVSGHHGRDYPNTEDRLTRAKSLTRALLTRSRSSPASGSGRQATHRRLPRS